MRTNRRERKRRKIMVGNRLTTYVFILMKKYVRFRSFLRVPIKNIPTTLQSIFYELTIVILLISLA